MNRKLIISLSMLLVILAVAVLLESYWHTYSDSPEDSDAIVILGVGDQGRVQKAADLYKSDYADKVIITPVGERYDSESTSTYTNALRTIEIMDENNFSSVLVVTNDYHIKRSKLIFERLNDGDKTFNYIAAHNLDGDRWYEREDAFRHWIGEFIKVWGYRLGLYKIFASI